MTETPGDTEAAKARADTRERRDGPKPPRDQATEVHGVPSGDRRADGDGSTPPPFRVDGRLTGWFENTARPLGCAL